MTALIAAPTPTVNIKAPTAIKNNAAQEKGIGIIEMPVNWFVGFYIKEIRTSCASSLPLCSLLVLQPPYYRTTQTVFTLSMFISQVKVQFLSFLVYHFLNWIRFEKLGFYFFFFYKVRNLESYRLEKGVDTEYWQV